MLHACTVIWKSKGGCDQTITLPESETVDYPRKREEKTQNTDSHNTIKLEQPTQLERTITTPQYNEVTQHKTPDTSEEIKQWTRKFDLTRVHYTVCGHHTPFNIFGEGVNNKCINATSYTLFKGPGRDKLAMSSTYSFSSLVENFKLFLLMLLVFLLCNCIFWRNNSSIPEIEHRIPYPWK